MDTQKDLPNETLKIYLCRHGETEWTISKQHTSVSDIPLTDRGKEQAHLLKSRLDKIDFEAVFCSPLKRSIETCQLAGFQELRKIDPDLQEWNYGDYEGMTSEAIWENDPNWTIFTDGAPDGESIHDVTLRADRIIKKLLTFQKNVAIFSHGHFSRVLAARWLQLPSQEGRMFSLSVASLGILGFEHQQRALHLWNDTSHWEHS